VGGISKYHNYASKKIEYLIKNAKLQIYGYGANKLPLNSTIRRNHKGERWGLDMYNILSRTKISFNRHINVAENNANNMRLYEATGMGSLLLTDRKDNLRKLFEEDREIVTYESKEEALEKYNYLINRPEELANIAKAGQLRTLKDHSYENRIKELIQIINKHL
jgi:spore maturation protein CgeB